MRAWNEAAQGGSETSSAVASRTGLPGAWPSQGPPAEERVTALLAGQRLHGCLKSYNDTNGYGFIECRESQELFKADVYISRRQVEAAHAQVGASLSFSIVLTQDGKPQARNVVVEFQGLPPEQRRAQQGHAPPDYRQQSPQERKCMGMIKSMGQATGIGFIDCPELRDISGGGCDVLLSKSQLSGFQVGDQVSFSVQIDPTGQSRPKASNLEPANHQPNPWGAWQQQMGYPMAMQMPNMAAYAGVDPMAMQMPNMAAMQQQMGGMGFPGFPPGMPAFPGMPPFGMLAPGFPFDAPRRRRRKNGAQSRSSSSSSSSDSGPPPPPRGKRRSSGGASNGEGAAQKGDGAARKKSGEGAARKRAKRSRTPPRRKADRALSPDDL